MRRTTTSWMAMKRRCLCENDRAYKFYGAKGVRVCAGMFDFDSFLALLGTRPKNKTLDRINPHLNYSCGRCAECLLHGWTMNVRWATDKTQAHNRRSHHEPPTPEQVRALAANATVEAELNEVVF
jgi:hypothetical protein